MSVRKTVVALAGLALTASLSAHAGIIGFTGAFDPGTWTTTFLGTLNLSAGGGPGSTSMTNSTLTIQGGDTGIDPNASSGCISGPCLIQITHAGSAFPFSFHWSYSTLDDPTLGTDPFGMLVNGSRITLASTAGASGDVTVAANTTFGWFINCTDCTSGAATAVVTSFAVADVAVPEPGSLALLGVGLAAGLIGVARRRA